MEAIIVIDGARYPRFQIEDFVHSSAEYFEEEQKDWKAMHDDDLEKWAKWYDYLWEK